MAVISANAVTEGKITTEAQRRGEELATELHRTTQKKKESATEPHRSTQKRKEKSSEILWKSVANLCVSVSPCFSFWRKSRFLLISLCIHIAAFMFLGMIALNVVPEPREFVSVQLVEATQQVRKLRRNIPKLRRQIGARHASPLPRRSQDAAKPLVSQMSISSQVATEALPIFQYEPVEVKESSTYLQIALPREPLAAPEVTTSKPVVHSPRESMLGIHDQLPRSSSPYSSVPLSVRSASDSAILQDFLQIVSRRIKKSKRYPRWAIDAGVEGKVVVRFTILRDGTLGEEFQLVRSSGTEVLDDAAIAAIKDAAPFPVLPQVLKREWLQIELPMDFRLRES